MRVCKCTERDCVYVGRACYGREGSALGNPFKVGRDGGLKEVLSKYRRWLFGRIEAHDEEVLCALRGIKDTDVLGCWCVNAEELPAKGEEACHAQVVWRAVHWLRGREG